MKEQIIRLEGHDDIVSARDKLQRLRAERVLLVFPEDPREAILQRRLDIVLLQREATRRQANLALITRDPVVMGHARELGIPHFASIKASRGQRWEATQADLRAIKREEQPIPLTRELVVAATDSEGGGFTSPPISQAGTIALFSGTLTMFLIVAFFIIPSAQVNIQPLSNQVSVTTTVRAIPGADDVDTATGTMPARRVGIELEGSTTVATTGTVAQPSANARGIVQLTNLFPEQVNVPAGTIVTTSAAQPVRFRTLEDITIPGQVGETVEVGIEALEPGFEGNLPSGRINVVEGTLDNRIGVANPEPTRGGDVIDVPAVSEEDRDRVRSLLLQQLQQRAFAEMQTDPLIGLQDTEFVPVESLTVVLVTTETYSGSVDSAAEELTLTMRVTIQGVAIDERVARQIIYARLAERVDPGSQLVAESLLFRRGEITAVNLDSGVEFIMQGAGDVTAAIDVNRLRRQIIGMTRQQAATTLVQDYPLTSRPTIDVQPSFWPIMPALPIRIDVQMEQPR